MALRRFSKFQLAMQEPIAYGVRAVASLPTVLPVDVAARGARQMARTFANSWINRKKLPRALKNLRDAYPAWSEDRVRETAIAAYEHLFQLGVEVLYAPRLVTEDGFSRHLDVRGLRRASETLINHGGAILISAHVGNWELIGYTVSMLGFPMHAVYRPLDLKPLDRWIRVTRERQGMVLVSKFGAMKLLPPVLSAGKSVGFVADQNGGDRGLFVPFFGRLTSTYKSIGLMAMKYRMPLICGFARRLGRDDPDPDEARMLGETERDDRGGSLPPQWRRGPDVPGCEGSAGDRPSMRYTAEVTDIFGPADWEGQPDPLFYITARYRRAIELMVRRAPEQYLWMHRIWRSRPAHERQNRPFPEALRAKLAALPWMTDEDVERVVDRSGRDVVDLKGAY